MTESRDDDSGIEDGDVKPRVDPRMKPFLRQAHAIIAAERGLNAQSQLKLRSLADHLKLPDGLYRKALAQLEKSKSKASRSHWEQAFVDFLNSEFAKLSQRIVTIGTETRAVELAKKKYQIEEVRAHQLISECAESLGLGRVAPEDARHHATELILGRIGDALSVNEELRSRLYDSGATWGMSREDVDALVLQRLVINRKQRRNQALRKWTVRLGALALIAGAVFVGTQLKWWDSLLTMAGFKAPKPIVVDSGAPTSALESPSEATLVAPAWWDQNLDESAAALFEARQDLRPHLLKIVRPESEERVQGLLRLFDLWCAESADAANRSEWLSFMSQAFLKEPSTEVQKELSLGFVEHVTQKPNRLQLKGEIDEAFLYADRLNEFWWNVRAKAGAKPGAKAGSDSEKTNEFRLVLQSRFGINDELESEATLEAIKATIAKDHWNHALANVWDSSARAAILVSPLYRATRRWMVRGELNQMHARMIESILEADESRWKDMRQAISEDIKVANELRINRWIDRYQATEFNELKDFLGLLLVEKTNVKPESMRYQDVGFSLNEFRIASLKEQLQPLLSRSRRVDELSKLVTGRKLMNRLEVSPDEIAKVVFAVNCTISLALDEKFDRDFLRFDSWIRAGMPDLKTLYPGAGVMGKTPVGAATTASASDNRNKRESVEKLARTNSLSTEARQSAFNQLCRVAKRFEQVSYPEAEVVAAYLLQDLELEEWLNVEKNIASCKHWPNLSLAISDQLIESNVRLDQAVTLFNLVFDSQYEIQDASRWREEMRLAMLTRVADGLKNNQARSQSQPMIDWARLKLYLSPAFEFRQQVVSGRSRVQRKKVPESLSESIVSQAEALELNTNESFGGLPAESESVQIGELIDESEYSELEKVVLANQLFAKVVAKRIVDEFPDQSWDVDDILLQYQQFSFLNSRIGHRLYLTELTLLRLWDLYRHRLVRSRLELRD